MPWPSPDSRWRLPPNQLPPTLLSSLLARHLFLLLFRLPCKSHLHETLHSPIANLHTVVKVCTMIFNDFISYAMSMGDQGHCCWSLSRILLLLQSRGNCLEHLWQQGHPFCGPNITWMRIGRFGIQTH
ncbi:hypothetical protein SLE2022_202690 [Rubroshorea leprosula]